MIIEGRGSENGRKRGSDAAAAGRFGLSARCCSSPHYARLPGTVDGDRIDNMSQRARRRPLLLAVLAASAFAWASPAAAVVDYCVTCKNPDATYRCRITGLGSKPSDALKLYCVIRTAKDGNHASCSAKKAAGGCDGLVKVYDYDGPVLPQGLASDPRLRELKQEVDKTQKDFDKPKGEGPQTLFQLGGRAVSASRKGLRNAGSAMGVTSSGTDAPSASAPAPDLPPPPPAASLPEEPATTASVAAPVESPGAGQRMKQAAQGASSAVGGFARKSYRCMRSLFRNCSEDAENGALE